jgi:hypothetical protein
MGEQQLMHRSTDQRQPRIIATLLPPRERSRQTVIARVAELARANLFLQGARSRRLEGTDAGKDKSRDIAHISLSSVSAARTSANSDMTSSLRQRVFVFSFATIVMSISPTVFTMRARATADSSP